MHINLLRPSVPSGLLAALLACTALLPPNALRADPVPVRHTEGLAYYGASREKRRRFRRLLRLHRALLAPTLWMLSRSKLT